MSVGKASVVYRQVPPRTEKWRFLKRKWKMWTLCYGGNRPAVDAEKPQCICCNIIRGGRRSSHTMQNQRVELAPQNENLCKIVTFHMFMVQCKSVTIWFVSDLRAHPWPPKIFASFVTVFYCGKAIFLGGHGCARWRKKCRTCNFRMSGTFIL